MRFSKYHGAGNDFIILDAMEKTINLTPEMIRALCHRNLGIGADGIIVFSPSRKGVCRMVNYNPDASEALFSGNGIRCLAKHLYEKGINDEREMLIETASGISKVFLLVVGGQVREVQVEMGKADFRRASIPMGGEGIEAVDETLKIDGRVFQVTCLSLGNPHCVIFLDSLSPSLVQELGPRIENHPLFPLRINVEFVEVLNMSELNQRSWERGAGETLSSATGACAAVAAAIRTGKGKEKMYVRQPGGLLEVNMSSEGTFYLRGPVRRVFDGQLDRDWWEKGRLKF